MPAILFGSISSLADTSELQRRAFNEAFAAHGLDWNWSRDEYSSLLGSNGGQNRIADYASERDVEVDAAEVHATKSQIFQELLGTSGVSPRAGVLDTVELAKSEGISLGFVTTTSAENVAALLSALSPDISADTFDIVIDKSAVGDVKPDPAAYLYALEQLGEDSADVVAIEDNVGGVAAANAAGVTCIAFPNQNTADSDFSSATTTVDALDAGTVLAFVKETA